LRHLAAAWSCSLASLWFKSGSKLPHSRRCTPHNVDPVTETLDDVRLVHAARDGDRAAFGLLYQRYARVVHGILLTRVPPGEADDLTQDVFLMALRRLGALRDAAAFPGWLASIARNRANDYHRRSPRHEELTEAVAEAAAQDERPQVQAHAALAAIRSLPDAYRETLMLRLVEGLTGPEIAERTGLTHGSVRVNLFRGMQMLKDKLEVRNQKSEESS